MITLSTDCIGCPAGNTFSSIISSLIFSTLMIDDLIVLSKIALSINSINTVKSVLSKMVAQIKNPTFAITLG